MGRRAETRVGQITGMLIGKNVVLQAARATCNRNVELDRVELGQGRYFKIVGRDVCEWMEDEDTQGHGHEPFSTSSPVSHTYLFVPLPEATLRVGPSLHSKCAMC